MERCSMHLLYITELRFYIRVIFDAYDQQNIYLQKIYYLQY